MQTLLGVTCSALFEVFESTRCGGSVPCSCFGFKSYPYFCRPFPVFIFAFHSTFVFFLRIKADKYDVAAWESLIVETSKVCHLCESHLFSVSVFKYYSSIYILLQKTQGNPSPHTTPPAFSSTFLLVINARLLQLNIVHARGFYKRFLEVFPTASAHWKVYVTTSISTSRHETAPLTTRQYIYGYVEDLDGP